jgi:Family of unknown function (DUF6788)
LTRSTSDTLQALRARRRELAAAITGVGFTAAGTVLQVRTVCGSPGCACHADPDKRHGPYWQHTRKIRNKTVTRRLTPAQAALYQEWIGNERTLRDLLAQMQQLSDQARELLLAGTPAHQNPAANPRDNRNQMRGT